MLYQSDSLSRIDLNTFVNDLTSGLVGMYKMTPGRINTHVRAEHIFLGIDQAIPCGLVINELISNAFKYAFPEHTGEIDIDLCLTAEDEVGLIVRDNGAGMPPNFNLRDSKTLGLKLVWGLVESQLGGKVAVDSEQGTRFTIRFPRRLTQNGRTFRI
jgi:two-component sensor histidine kinase